MIGDGNDNEGRPDCHRSITTPSGEPCPCSGEWEIIGSPSTTAVFSKGKLMPEYYGKKVVWILIRAG